MSVLAYPFNLLKEHGLLLAPLNNGDWMCGRANLIYHLDPLQDHYKDPRLSIDTDPDLAIAAAMLTKADD